MTEMENANQKFPHHDSKPNMRPFRNRVRILIEILGDENEMALAKAAFQNKGWVTRLPKQSEIHGYSAGQRTWLVLEVRFPGFPRTATTAAVKLVDRVIDNFRIAAVVRRAEIIKSQHDPHNTYFIYDPVPRFLARSRLLARIARTAAVPQMTGLLRLNAKVPDSEIRSKLAEIDLGESIVRTNRSIQPAIAVMSPEGKLVTAKPVPLCLRLLGGSGMTAAALCGFVAGWTPGAYREIPAIAGLVMTAPAMASFPPNQRLRRRILAAITYTILLICVGFYAAGFYPRHNLLAPVKIALLMLILAFIWRGLSHILHDSWLLRQINWVLPLSLTILTPFALWLGGQYDEQYLTARFGIPVDAVSVPTFDRLSIASVSFLAGLLFVLFFAAAIGWLRYFHLLDDSNRWLPVLTTVLLSLAYFLSSISIGLTRVNDASANAAKQAQMGLQPADYFGIKGRLQCVRPVTASIPEYNGPLPSKQPVLSFNPTGGDLWIWDPVSGRAIKVPLNDVDVTLAKGTPARCR